VEKKQPVEKKQYESPDLVVYGTLSDLARADGPNSTHPDSSGGPHRT
jgi:hypothetical protein